MVITNYFLKSQITSSVAENGLYKYSCDAVVMIGIICILNVGSLILIIHF